MPRLGLGAVACGLLLAAATPALGQSFCAWFALVPLAWAIDGERTGKAFALGWLAGFSFFLVEFDWVPGTIVRATGIAALYALLPFVLLAGVLAISIGVFAAALRYWQARTGRSGIVAAALFWTGIEWVRSNAWLPCPWGLLGYALHEDRSLVQLADLTGVFGLSALLVAANLAAYTAAFRRDRRSVAALAVVALVVVATSLYGATRLEELARRPVTATLRVGIVQPAIDPNQKWDAAARESVLAISEELSRTAVTGGAELVIWPEASAPYVFASDELYDLDPERFAVDRVDRDRMVAFVRALGVPLLLGAPAATPQPLGRGEAWNFVNRSLLLSRDGSVVADYDKTILVPFGEYVPFSRMLFFVDKLVPAVGNFVPGEGPTQFSAAGPPFAVLICYEAIFGDYTRRMVDGGASFLINQTNDAWFGISSAPIQHFAQAKIRAVENHVPLVRVANTGISAVVDVDGTVEHEMSLGERGVEVVELRLRQGAPSFYTRYGDLFAEGAALAALALLLYAGWSTREPAAEAVVPA